MRCFALLAPTHNSKMFLDCCGLVRQVLRDLKSEFGFNVGPWNQAYLVRTCVQLDGTIHAWR